MALVDEVTLQSNDIHRTPPHKRLLVYYIAGNPGLIGYYCDFLREVFQNLGKADEDSNVVIHGTSSDGFEFHRPSRNTQKPPPYGLAEQIEFAKRNLSRKVTELVGDKPAAPIPVVLVAHSVGAYILLEIVAWWQRHTDQQSRYHIVGGICLFPTVVDIAKSEKGRQLSWFLALPYAWLIVQWLAKLLALVPVWLWNWPKVLTPGDLHADVTEGMVRSQNGVGQVLFMANDEMRTIKANQWPDELWGIRVRGEEAVDRAAASDDVPKTKLFFYWGNDDYWVDNRVRDDLIAQIAQRASRGNMKKEDSPQMRIDANGIPHTFSLMAKHKSILAKEVAEYVCELKQRCRTASLL